MKIFGYEIRKANTDSGNRNIPLDVVANTIEKNQYGGGVQHENYAQLVRQYKGWVYVGVFKNAVCVAKYPLKLYAVKRKSTTKIISKHIAVEDSFKDYMSKSAHLRGYLTNSDDVVEVLDHPVLDLLTTVNPQQNRFDLFSKTIMFLDLTGNSYWYLVYNKLGLPEQIWPLSPVNMKVNIKEEGKSGEFIAGYTMTNGTDKIFFKKEEIIHFTFPSPFSNIYGMGALAAGQDSISFDNKSRSYENTLLDNQCRPDVILQTDQKISDADHQSLLGRLRNAYAGRKGLGKWMILDKGLTASPLNLPLREMGFLQGRKVSKEEIAGILGIPVSKLTTEDVNLANAYEGSVQYITDTIAPRLTMIEEKLNERLMPMYDENLFVTYGNVLPTDKNYRLMEIEKHLGTNYSSINEERKIDGLKPVEWGDKPMETAPVAPPASANLEQAPPEPAVPETPAKPKHWLDIEEEQEELTQEIMNRVLARLR